MKLLFDQNLAPRLVAQLAELFPGSEHVRHAGLAASDDVAVWEYAKAGGFAIVSKDADFRQLSFFYGSPPKVVWLRVGNRSTAEIEAIVRANAGDLEAFNDDPLCPRPARVRPCATCIGARVSFASRRLDARDHGVVAGFGAGLPGTVGERALAQLAPRQGGAGRAFSLTRRGQPSRGGRATRAPGLRSS